MEKPTKELFHIEFWAVDSWIRSCTFRHEYDKIATDEICNRKDIEYRAISITECQND